MEFYTRHLAKCLNFWYHLLHNVLPAVFTLQAVNESFSVIFLQCIISVDFSAFIKCLTAVRFGHVISFLMSLTQHNWVKKKCYWVLRVWVKSWLTKRRKWMSAKLWKTFALISRTVSCGHWYFINATDPDSPNHFLNENISLWGWRVWISGAVPLLLCNQLFIQPRGRLSQQITHIYQPCISFTHTHTHIDWTCVKVLQL